jgi:lysozyme
VLDLSNNNGAVDFERIYDGGTRRVYLKCTEGTNFLDKTAAPFFHRAKAAHLKVGFYHFARPSQNPGVDGASREAAFFLRNLPTGWHQKNGTTLRPCLDLEDPHAPPSVKIAQWAHEFILYVKNHTGLYPIIYGNTYYLQGCSFHKPWAKLWLASYGRNDGKEHPYIIPKPWLKKDLAAHQYSSEAHVAGVEGVVDISHVFKPRQLDVRRFSR